MHRLILALILLLAAIVPAHAEPKRQVIIDDDGFALLHLLLLEDPRVEVLGITSVSGNVWANRAQAMALRGLERLAKAALPPVAAMIRNLEPGFPMWDEIAAAIWLDPSLVTKSERLWYDFDVEFGPGYGDMLTWRDACRPGLDEGQADMVMWGHVPRMEALMARTLGGQ